MFYKEKNESHLRNLWKMSWTQWQSREWLLVCFGNQNVTLLEREVFFFLLLFTQIGRVRSLETMKSHGAKSPNTASIWQRHEVWIFWKCWKELPLMENIFYYTTFLLSLPNKVRFWNQLFESSMGHRVKARVNMQPVNNRRALPLTTVTGTWSLQQREI